MSTNNEVIIIAAAANGETTVVEIIATDSDSLLTKDSDGHTLVEEVIEAVLDQIDESNVDETFDENPGDSNANALGSSADGTAINDGESILNSTGEFDAAIAGFNTQDDSDLAFDAAAPTEIDLTGASDTGANFTTFDASAGIVGTNVTDTETTESVSGTVEGSDFGIDTETQANFDLATEAQAKADEAIEAGDYEAAAQYREDAQDAAWQAGDDSMLHGSDSNDLMMADAYQEKAEYAEAQQAEYAQAGDYEAARDASRDAATYTQWADSDAGGADHSAEANYEHQQMDMADWEQDTADYYQQNAEAYAAQGDIENAATYQGEASEHQDTADYYGDLGEHNGTYDQFESVPDASYSGCDYSTDYASADYSSTDYTSSCSSYDSSSDTE